MAHLVKRYTFASWSAIVRCTACERTSRRMRLEQPVDALRFSYGGYLRL